MVIVGRLTLATHLREFDEETCADWVLGCSDDDLFRIGDVGDWILHHGPSTPTGNSMQIRKALALAAVYIREGAPRELARKRARTLSGPKPGEDTLPPLREALALPKGYAVGQDAVAYWTGGGVRPRRPDAVRPRTRPSGTARG